MKKHSWDRLRSTAALLFVVACLLLATFAAAYPLHSQREGGAPASTQAPDERTAKAVAEYAAQLVRAFVDTADPLAPDPKAREILARVVEALRSQEPVVVFNGKVYRDIVAAGIVNEGKPDAYFFKPAGAELPRSEYLAVIAAEAIDPAEFIDAAQEPVQRELRRMFYAYIADRRAKDARNAPPDPGVLPGSVTPEFASAVQAYLEKKKAEGVLSSFTYRPDMDTLELIYRGLDIPVRLAPLMDGKMIDFVILAHGQAKKYAQMALRDYRRRLAAGEALVVNTKTPKQLHDFFSREALRQDLSVICDEALTREEKLQKLSEGLRIGASPGSSGLLDFRKLTASLSPMAQAAPGGSAVQKLLAREGVVVPPTKRIVFMRGPDYIVRQYLEGDVMRQESYEIRQMKDPSGFLSVYRENGFTVDVVTAGWGERFTDTLARVMADESASVVYFKTHGDDGALLAEMYDLGVVKFTGSDASFNEIMAKTKEFGARVRALREKYGADAIKLYMNMRTDLSESDRQVLSGYEAQIPERLRHLLKEERKLGVIAVTREFFAKIPARKALVILRACHGGSMAGAIKTRVLLAPDPRCFTTEYMFVQSDLNKLAPYLHKTMDPGPVVVTKASMRNYSIIDSFKTPPVLRPGVHPDVERRVIDDIFPQRDRLLSIRMWADGGRNVSPSPHVEEADGDRILFNAPMDTSIPAEEVVTVKTPFPPEKTGELKPRWVNDREIALPWKGQLYRDWDDKDFYANGHPEADYAVITVNHDKAVSALSRVELSGNSDGVGPQVCKVKECWRDPCLIRYNGNHPKTDFVLMRPCIKEEKPKTPEALPSGCECVRHFLYPDKGNYFNSLIVDGGVAIDQKESYEKYRQSKMADVSKEATYVTFDRFMPLAAFQDHRSYVRETAGDDQFYELFLDGSVAYKGKEQPSALQLFGDHHMYWLGSDKMVYDGRQHDADTMGQCVLSTTSMLSLNNRWELRLDGNLIGAARPGSTVTVPESVQLTNKGLPPYPYGAESGLSPYRFQGVHHFKDNVAFFDAHGHAMLYRGGALHDLGAAHDMFLFGDHVVVVRMVQYTDETGGHAYLKVEYDGLDLGPGEYPIIFGDHLAFVAPCNPKAKRGLGFEKPAAYLFRKEGEAFFPDYKRFIFLDGDYIDVAKMLELSPEHDYSLTGLRFLDGKLAFNLHIRDTATGESSVRLIYDWKDAGPTREQYFRFKGHEVYVERINEEDHVVYDGRDLGVGSHPVIVESHLVYRTVDSEEGDQVVYDGKRYPSNSSMYANMRGCWKLYLETKVPTSPYGTVRFDREKER